MIKNAAYSSTSAWEQKSKPIKWEMNTKAIYSKSREEMTNKDSPWNKEYLLKVELDFLFPKAILATDLEELVREKENQLEDASLDKISVFYLWQLSKREKKIFQELLIKIFQEDWGQREYQKSEDYLIWKKLIASNWSKKPLWEELGLVWLENKDKKLLKFNA